MHISLDWIRDFAAVPELPPRELASRFTLSTAEVEDVKIVGQGLEAVQIVQVLSKKPHPEADKLNLVTFDVGGGTTKEVVCGAPNVKEGMKVFYAPVGTTLPGGLTLEPKKIRGILSDGMLCSSSELGLGEGVDGLMELPPSSPVGAKFLDHMKVTKDVILEVDNKSLTHRPDLWGHYGLAREFAASHGVPLKDAYGEEWEKAQSAKCGQGRGTVTFRVEDDSACWAYLGLNMEGVRVGPSPEWMQRRLTAVGLRPINNIVDASNYVMLELGLPNHVFDAAAIQGGKLTIRRCGAPGPFRTLDGQERALVATDTVIADEAGPSVLAGIMGGEASGVSEATTRVFLEVANWDPSEVRKTSVRLGLRSDSSQRFEKTLDSHLCRRSLLRLMQLIMELCPGAKPVGQMQAWYRDDKLAKPVTLSFPLTRITRVLGKDLPAGQIEGLFSSLGFAVNLKGADFTVTVPTWRTTKDISCVDDLIEEVGRLIGYDNITPVSPLLPVKPVRLSPSKTLFRRVQDFMVQEAKALEVMTYPLVGKDLLAKAVWPCDDKLLLVNALSQDADRMRPSLIPSALALVAENQKHYPSFSFFEWGRAYFGFESERTCLLLGLYSREEGRFTELLNHVDKLLSSLGLAVEIGPRNEKFSNPLMPAGWTGQHPHEYVNIRIQGKFQGVATTAHPLVLRNFKAKGHFSFVVIDFTDFEHREPKDKTKYSPIPKFPASSFDISVSATMETPAADVLRPLVGKLKHLKSARLLGVYPYSETHKSVTLRTVFEDPTTTLSAEFLKEAEKQVVQTLEKSGFPLRT